MLFCRPFLQRGQVKHIVFSSLLSSQPPSSGLQSSLGPLDALQLVDKASNLHLKLLLNFFPMVSHTVSSTSAFYPSSAHTVSWKQEQEDKGKAAELLDVAGARRGMEGTGPASWKSKPASQGLFSASPLCFEYILSWQWNTYWSSLKTCKTQTWEQENKIHG